MKKYDVLVLSCLLIASEAALADLGNHCPTAFNQEELHAFETAVKGATLTPDKRIQDRRMKFDYNGMTYYMPVEDQEVFLQKNLPSKKAATRLIKITYKKDETEVTRVRCFYTQTRESTYILGGHYLIPFRMTYFANVKKK